MKNETKKFFIMLLVLVLAISNPVALFGLDDLLVETNDQSINEMIAELYGYEFMINHNNSMEIIQNFYKSLPRDRAGEFIYPEQFGGMYIDDYGNLVLLVVNNHIADYNHTMNFFSDARVGDGIIVVDANFTFGDLNHLMTMLDNIIPNTITPATYNITGWSLDVINNRVNVRLLDYGKEQIMLFNELVIDSPMIEFMQCYGRELYIGSDFDILNFQALRTTPPAIDIELVQEANTRNAITIFPGQAILISRNGSWVGAGSIGYRAARNGRLGFITASHLSLGMTNVRLQSGDRVHVNQFNPRYVGTVRDASLSWVDAAFVETPPEVFFMQSVPQAPLLPITIPPVVGNVAFTVGATTGLWDARIAEVRASFMWNNGGAGNMPMSILLENAVITWPPARMPQGGDSGGLVYSQLSGRFEAGVIGIHLGRTNDIHGNLNMPVISTANAITRILNAPPS